MGVPRSAKLVAAIAAFGALAVAVLWGARSESRSRDRQAVRAALNTHCIDCHDADTQSGGLLLELDELADVGAHTEVWERVARQIDVRAMPPPEEPRPDENTYRTLQSYLESALDEHAAAVPNAGEQPQLHRLTRTEYRNAIRDLLALRSLPAELDFELLLPADNTNSGFDNIAELLFMSPPIMERYMDAARKISRLAVGDTRAPALVNRHRMPLQLPQDRHVEDLPLGTRGGIAIESYFPLDAEYVVRVDFARDIDDAQELEVLVDGESVDRLLIEPRADGRRRAPEPAEFRIAGKAGPAQIGVTFVERAEAFDESTLRVRRRSRGTLPSIDLVTISGPYAAIGPGDTPSRRRIFTCTPATDDDPHGCANEILTTLVRKAYRRPASAEDLEDLAPFFEAGLADGGFDIGIERALERVLISPQFLYRIERDPPDAVPGRAFNVSDLELASRLSFFLWSSIPDDELLELASAGRLRSPRTLDRQVERMLADPRASSLVDNFAAQWLYLRDVAGKDPDLFLFRDYDETLRDSLVRETELFVDSIVRENRSVIDLITADHTFLNERLAEHYGIPNIHGSRFRRVTLPPDSPRIGLFGKGAILRLTSYSTRTSPVLRGKYVLENLLGSPPPPPPPDVPSLAVEDQTDGRPLTMREALARHRAEPRCAGCHAEMDAIGFALERFDAIGQWRDWDADTPIDSTSTLPDGTPIDGVTGLRAYLAAHPKRFAQTFTEKLLMYALGRNIQYFDAPAVRAIVRDAASEDYSVASIVKGVVRSVPFQMRNAQPAGRDADRGGS